MWRVAQAVYMPQTPAYLADGSDESDEPDPSAYGGSPDDSKPETWPLFLPSAVPEGERSLCYKGIVETEGVLRLAQLQDNLAGLRTFRRSLRNLRLYFKTNIAGEGQKTQTKSRTIETGVANRIRRVVWRYRVAHHALFSLDAAGDWTKEYRELKDEDNRGPLKEAEERGPGDGRYQPSWIWTGPSSMALPAEGSAAEQREVYETARYEWMTCKARADRWMEEVELLQEEMRRVVVFLEWKSCWWSGGVGARAGSCPPDVQQGVDAYARRQANVYREMALLVAEQWLPYLKAHGLDIGWATDLPWLSGILSHPIVLPKRYAVIPTDGSPKPPSPGTGAETWEHLVACETQGVGSGYGGEDGCSGRSNGEGRDGGGRGYDGEGGQDFDGEGEWDSDDEERYLYDGGEGDEDRGSDHDAESGDEFGFEYDDEYLS